MPNPVVSKIQLGLEIRKLRKAAGATREEVAKALDCDVSKISRLESGKASLRTPEVDSLARHFGMPDEKVEPLRRLAAAARSRSTYRVPDWAQRYAGLEQESTEIRVYETELIPGLLQTEDYVRAIMHAAMPCKSNDEIDRLVAGRMSRQSKLFGDNVPHLVAIINEGAIRRIVGGRAAMKAQLNQLLDFGQLHHVDLHVLSFEAGAHCSMGTSFTLLYLPDPIDVRIAYLEDVLGADYLEEPEEIRTYSLNFERLLGAALTPVKSLQVIDQIQHDL
ncbi:helix-turn-helix domain-containing protein [Goodfellowiella coeruleoviolacea]|uniref:Helix-turn-helix domain-containing protein n=1 Tax=Goodfellowiella coeruleoviolacea TaxID=334858 RepID=A0AAE3GFT2_9PSEU|nr:helix-turn-helix transcriptional regulator [Goodfellowiella coeruleoviolacea]MCP2167305.1 Helix-turn-helix domain-containing protein [Goodfellowiella coeruleoviolacea]